jgi:hypothetical protein
MYTIKIIDAMDEGALYEFLCQSFATAARLKTSDETRANICPAVPARKTKQRDQTLLLHRHYANNFAMVLYVLRLLNLENFDAAIHGERLKHFLTIWVHKFKHDKCFRKRFADLVSKNCFAHVQKYVASETLYREVIHFFSSIAKPQLFIYVYKKF